MNTINTKNPLIAAILNIIPGLGYVYVGNKKLFGFLLLIGILLSNVALFDPKLNVFSEEVINAPMNMWTATGWLGQIIFIGAFIFDGYKNALAFNINNTKRGKK